MSHRCDETCVCPEHPEPLPLYYHRPSDQHACSDPMCINARGMDAPDCRCPTPNRPTGRESEPQPPWVCLTCSGFACEYADPGQTRCPQSLCDCFIATFPDSPRDLHPEAFIVGRALPKEPS